MPAGGLLCIAIIVKVKPPQELRFPFDIYFNRDYVKKKFKIKINTKR